MCSTVLFVFFVVVVEEIVRCHSMYKCPICGFWTWCCGVSLLVNCVVDCGLCVDRLWVVGVLIVSIVVRAGSIHLEGMAVLVCKYGSGCSEG